MPELQRISTVPAMQDQSETWRYGGLRIGLVPTMGFLHEGHLSLVDYSMAHTDRTVVSIFVNPLQFGPREDLTFYPRDIDRDLNLLNQRGVDAVFYPEALEFYPPNFSTFVEVKELTIGLCGAFRPGHFRGVTTVVAKLFNAVRPHLAVFGQKDYQQSAIIRRLVNDLNLNLSVEVAPTIRETDGLAMSSRNINLSDGERRRAPALYRTIVIGKERIEEGQRDATAIIADMRAIIERDLTTDIDYISIVHPDTLVQVTEITSPVVIAIAVRMAKVRLIDNISASPPMK